MRDVPRKKLGLPEVLGFLVLLVAGKCLVYSWVPTADLFIGLGGSFLAALALVGIQAAIWKTAAFSWRAVLGLSGALALISVTLILWANRATF